MKRAFSILAALIFLLAAGCEKQGINETAPPAAPTAFTANLNVTFGDTEMTAKLTQNSPDSFEIQILSPEILSSLALAYANGTCTVTYDGLKFETDLTRFPQAEFGALVTQTLADIAQDMNIQKTYSEGVWTYKGAGERGTFSLTQSAETGAWLELTVDGADLHVVFSDVALTQ
ncbi:MAG: hypothetical protein J6B52_03290 [Clostridia bacterium]|nr:hypothetical protein [Clostridia bacterium]